MDHHDHLSGAGYPQDGSAGFRVRVVLAENHERMRRSLRLLLEAEQDIDVVAEARDVPGAIDCVLACEPHVLVLDIGMSSGSSVEVIRRLHAQLPATAVVAITMTEAPALAKYALDAGAVGFVLKDTADDELADAVRLAARGQVYTSPRVASGLAALTRTLTAH